jgi:putative aldouronate transport system permease protein
MVPPARHGRRMRTFLQNKTLLFMCLPAIIFFIIFCYVPMPGAYVAFVQFNYSKGIFKSPFVGMRNFSSLFSNGALFSLTWNTFFYNLLFLVTTTVGAIAIAIMLSEIGNRHFKRITQTVMFLPYFISFVLVGLFLFSFINYDNGLLNGLLQSIGLQKVEFYSRPGPWPAILTIVNFWKNAGYNAVIYLGVIASLDINLNEAASIDGASTWQRIWHITLPGIRPTIVILTLFAIGGILKGNFDLFFNTVGLNSLLFQTTDVFETYVFRTLMVSFNFSTGSAVGLYQSIFGLVLVLLANWAVRRVEPDYALF